MTHFEWFLSGMLFLQTIFVVQLTMELNHCHKILMRYGEVFDDLLSRKDRPND